ncbi:WXG100 family type VII secretion target [Streptomyces himalayensis]|uniref:WXG100 family type VII secretion target n=1 Tax=Streptomyces himalayensis subsp. himalayensis TaxID=2756131 RepID=A0A7W0DIE2_9ACTN|nr:WXG100 family type VII secretion target [Streptomyces himalayensis]MBA2944934.1 WXG100 family type VII secretion target [Streptomyces himalayensis subsp. himalayensis]
MAANPYPSLGWNPVPGVPEEVSALHQKVKSAAETLDNCHRQIESLLAASSSWEGDAASAFRESLDGDLKEYMRNAGRSLGKAATWLGQWDGDLASHRDLAKKYDDAAREKKAAADKAQQRHDEASKNPDLKLGGKQYPSQEEADAATARLRAAEGALNEATTSLNNATTAYNDVIQKARELEGEHTQRSEFIAGKLDEADDKLAPKEPGWLSKTVQAIGDVIAWVGKQIWEHAGTIGAIAGLLALLPTPAAPIFAAIAVGASALAMAKNLSSEDFRDALTGEYGLKEQAFAVGSMVGDGLGMVPGVGALAKAGSEMGMAAALAREGGEAMSLGSKFAKFGSEIVPAFQFKALDAATDPRVGMLQYSIQGVNIVGNMASSLETLGVLPKDGPGHDAAEATKIGAASTGLKSGVIQIMDDLGDMVTGIRL